MRVYGSPMKIFEIFGLNVKILKIQKVALFHHIGDFGKIVEMFEGINAKMTLEGRNRQKNLVM